MTNTTDISVNAPADLAAWCLTQLDGQQVVYSSTLPGATAVTRTQAYTPDTPATCRIKTMVTEPNANSALYKVTEALVFDAFGNVYTDTVTGNNMPSSPPTRTTTNNWGTTGQFLNSRTISTGTVAAPTTATTSWSYASSQSLMFGVPDSMTDANALQVLWTYDGFGRKSKETRPDNTATIWTLNWCDAHCGWSNSIYQIAQTALQTDGTTTIGTETNYYDPVDRGIQSTGPSLSGALKVVQTLYNSLGQLAQQSMPFLSGSPSYFKTYNYDTLNRVTSVSRPISSTNPSLQSIAFQYAGRTTTVKDPYLHAKTMVYDVNGTLRQTTDALGYSVTRTYDAANSLTGITDSAGNTLLSGTCSGGACYVYGIKPFRVSAKDADRGAWTYTVDSLGERTGWTDAKGQSFTMTFDALSRPSTRNEPDLFTQWTYGSTPASHNVGQLISECTGMTGTPPSSCGTSPIYLETRTFDSYGRPSTRAISESANPGHDPGGVYLFTTAYSTTTGLPSTLTYPISTGTVPLRLQYGYQNGLLQSITDATDTTTTCGTSCTLWTANATNGVGQITQETLGNGVVINRSYDAVTSWLSGATAGVGSGAALLNQSYLEDENGNVIQRQQNNAPGVTESFAYDADNRLTCTALASTCTTPTITYDGGTAGPGNISSQTGVGTYTYPPAGQSRPHAVTSITGTFNGIVNPSFAYDANGNMTNRASPNANIAWTSFNYPKSISATDVTGSETVAINYGPDRQRVQQNYTLGGATETTFYVGGLMDIVFAASSIDNRHYIYAGDEPIAVYSRTAAGINTMSYMLGDHQGSLSTITSKSGAVDINESFSAFGVRRNPATWSGAPTSADLNTIAGLTRQGYGFQTALGQSMGLNHMNGRVQDAILGRFLSPDTHVPDSTDAQSYNRYSYVNSNPVTLTDPSGFTPWGNITPCIDVCTNGGKNRPPAIAGGGNTGDGGLGGYIGFNANDSDLTTTGSRVSLGAGLDEGTITWGLTYGYSIGSDGKVDLGLPDTSNVVVAAAAALASYNSNRVGIVGFTTQSIFTTAVDGTNGVLFTNDGSSSSLDWVEAFTGTATFSDWKADGANALGTSARYDAAVAIASATQAVYGDNGLLTGHSLGGGEAALASWATGVPAITFNAAGVNPSRYGYPGNASQITNYTVGGEPLTTTQSLTPLPSALGTQVMMSPATIPGSGNSLNHGMNAVIPALCKYLGNCGP